MSLSRQQFRLRMAQGSLPGNWAAERGRRVPGSCGDGKRERAPARLLSLCGAGTAPRMHRHGLPQSHAQSLRGTFNSDGVLPLTIKTDAGRGRRSGGTTARVPGQLPSDGLLRLVVSLFLFRPLRSPWAYGFVPCFFRVTYCVCVFCH